MTAEVTSELRCFIRHLRSEKICSAGGRVWWPAHGLDWGDFLANGIPASVLAETGDAFALRVVAAAEREAELERNGW